MLSAATRVLRLAFEPTNAREPIPADPTVIEFVAYARDSLLTGSLRLDADRLTDLLNASDELDLVNAVWVALDGRTVQAEDAIVPRSDLVAVKAGDPRGNPAYRHHTRQFAVTAGAGNYVMHGFIHGRPGADPMIHLGRRPPMIPLTDATIIYETADGWHRDEAATLIVNRDVADWLRPAKEDELQRLRARPGAA
jgi:hypothetical protein